MKKNNVLKILVLVTFAFFFVVPTTLVLAQQYSVGGLYNATGTNPNGTTYHGTVTITKMGEVYNFEWKVGTTYTGTGKLEGNVLTVNWGAAYPVIYVVEDGGNRLVGKWDNGRASETLTK